jgi:3-hydroxyisobutyrate dehydrogenase-like beta-hydroxyacid dehydrogenase
MTAADNHAEHERIAVLGTGIMGSAMARNLVAAGLATVALGGHQ